MKPEAKKSVFLRISCECLSSCADISARLSAAMLAYKNQEVHDTKVHRQLFWHFWPPLDKDMTFSAADIDHETQPKALEKVNIHCR